MFIICTGTAIFTYTFVDLSLLGDNMVGGKV